MPTKPKPTIDPPRGIAEVASEPHQAGIGHGAVLSAMFITALLASTPMATGQAGTQIESDELLGCNDANLSLNAGAVDISGHRAIVGGDGISIAGEGVVAIYQFDGIVWTLDVQLSASDAVPGDNFGFSVAIDGNTAVVGAPGQDNGLGAVYVFSRNGQGDWIQEAKLTSTFGLQFGSGFGWSVDLAGNRVAVGQPNFADVNACPPGDSANGTAYVYVSNGAGNWSLENQFFACLIDFGVEPPPKCSSTQLVASVIPLRFGESVALGQDFLVVGAPDSTVNAFCPPAGLQSGAGYLFTRDPLSGWIGPLALLPQESQTLSEFGASVAADGSMALVGHPSFTWTVVIPGAPGFPDTLDFVQSGATSVYEFATPGVAPIATLGAPGLPPGADFGRSVDLEKDCTFLIGAPAEWINGAPRGAAYIFDWLGLTPTDPIRFDPGGTATHTQLGMHVAVDAKRALVDVSRPETNESTVLVYDVLHHLELHGLPMIDDPLNQPGSCIEWVPEFNAPNATGFDGVLANGLYTVNEITAAPGAALGPALTLSRVLPEFESYAAMLDYDPTPDYSATLDWSWMQATDAGMMSSGLLLRDAGGSIIVSAGNFDFLSAAPSSAYIQFFNPPLPITLGPSLPLSGSGIVEIDVSELLSGLWEIIVTVMDATGTPLVTETEVSTLRPATIAMFATRDMDMAIPFGSASFDRVTVISTGPPCPGDTNSDRFVDVSDLLKVLGSWGDVFECHDPADFNLDDVVDVTDLLLVLAHFGPCPGCP